MIQDNVSLVESHCSGFQPLRHTGIMYKHIGVSRYRMLCAVLIGFGVIVSVVLLLVLSYFMHVYTGGHAGDILHYSLNPICLQPRVTGKCRASLLRWVWNPQANTCEEFIYGGCGANENNFLTKEECETVCKMRINV
uniref:Kunitz-type protease inhibitor 2 n=1 Tax=Schistosoma japonicum TaxID=6182 RepID=C1LHI3_SCHJA|nr:Kunitz-type protease inhibitor 2 precursor [Schistosoma japonicum]